MDIIKNKIKEWEEHLQKVSNQKRITENSLKQISDEEIATIGAINALKEFLADSVSNNKGEKNYEEGIVIAPDPKHEEK